MLVDVSDIKKELNEEEKEIFDKVCKAMNAKSFTVRMLNFAFGAILLYVCFAFLPLWASISLIGIKLAIPVVKLTHIVYATIKLNKKYENFCKIINSIRYKICEYTNNK